MPKGPPAKPNRPARPARPGPRGARRPAAGTPGVRLQRVLADAGVASRRAAEEMILGGRVEVNGELVTTLPAFVRPGVDRVRVDGRPVEGEQRHVYILLNKPTRTVATNRDEPGLDRRTIAQMVQHPTAPRLFPVGRLDFDTTGLILLTNDGELANRLTHPRYGVKKTYALVVRGVPDGALMDKLQKAVLGRGAARREPGPDPARARREIPTRAPTTEGSAPALRLLGRERDRATLELTLSDGRLSQVRRLLAREGCAVKKLTRTAIGPLRLSGLAVGQWRELERHEVQALRRAARAGAKAAPPASVGKPGAGTSDTSPVRPRAAARRRAGGDIIERTGGARGE